MGGRLDWEGGREVGRKVRMGGRREVGRKVRVGGGEIGWEEG